MIILSAFGTVEIIRLFLVFNPAKGIGPMGDAATGDNTYSNGKRQPAHTEI